MSLVILSLIWGYNWVVIKVATDNADAFTVAMLRCALGALCLIVAIAAMRGSLRPPPLVPTLILGLTQTTLFILFQTAAVSLGGAGKTAVLVYTMPFWTILLAVTLLGERVHVKGSIAVTFAAIGLGFVLWPIDIAHGLASKAFAIAAAISWAASAIYSKRLQMKHAVDTLALTSWQMVYGTIPLLVIWAFVPGKHVTLSLAFMISMSYIVVLSSAIAWLLWTYVLKRLSASVAGIASLGGPVVGVAAAAIQLHEIPSTLELIGIAAIVAALVVNTLPSRAEAV